MNTCSIISYSLHSMMKSSTIKLLLVYTLCKKLQMDPKLTLEKAMVAACKREAFKKQQAVVRGEHPSIDAICTIHTKGSHQAEEIQADSLLPRAARDLGDRSPLPTHGHQQCPARKPKCHNYSVIIAERFETECRPAQTVGTVQVAEDEFLHVGTV